MMNFRSNMRRLAAASVAAAGLCLIAVPGTAWANNAQSTSPTSGAESTAFSFLTTGTACPLATNQPGGDVLDSFVVDNSMVSTSQLGQMTFSGGLPNFGTYTGATMLLSTGNSPFTNIATLPASSGSTAGGWPAATQGPYSWNKYATTNDYGPGNDLYDGTFNVGIACVTPSGTVDSNQFWSLQVSFSSGGTNAPPFTWASQPGPSTPEVPFALILPIAGTGILLAGAFLVRRRQRKMAAVSV
jgi:hypothetical protein